MLTDKIKKRNLDKSLLDYLRNIDIKITYDDLDPQIIKEIKNMLPMNGNVSYRSYDDFELRNRISLLENNKLDAESAFTEDDFDEKIKSVNSSLKNTIKTEMLNYIKNEGNVISEYLLSEDLRNKINARIESKRPYYVSYEDTPSYGGGGTEIPEGSSGEISVKIQTLEKNVKNNSDKTKTNEDNIKTNKQNIELLTGRVDGITSNVESRIDSVTEIITGNYDDLNGKIGKNEDALKNIYKTSNDNANSIVLLRGMFDSLSKDIKENYISTDDKISFDQTDFEFQEKFEGIRYNTAKITLQDLEVSTRDKIENARTSDVKITINDLDYDLASMISSGGGGLSGGSNVENGHVMMLKKDENGINSTETRFIYENDVMVINNPSLLNSYKAECVAEECYTIYELSENVVYEYDEENKVWNVASDRASDRLSGRFFTIEPQMDLCFCTSYLDVVDIINLSELLIYNYTNNKFATIQSLNTVNTNINSSISSINGSINGINNSIGGINNSINTINTDIDEIGTNINTINNNIKDLGTIRGNINSLQTSVNSKADKTSVTNLSNEVQDLTTELQDLKTLVNKLQARITELEK